MSSPAAPLSLLGSLGVEHVGTSEAMIPLDSHSHSARKYQQEYNLQECSLLAVNNHS